MVIVLQSETDARAGDPPSKRPRPGAGQRPKRAARHRSPEPHVLAPRQVSADGKTVYEIVALDLSPDDSPDALAPVEDAIHPQPGLKIMLAGGPAFYGDIQVLSENDLRRSEVISLPLAALALLLVFGSVVAAGVPIVVGGIAVVVALAAIYFVAQATPMSIFVLNLATLLGFGLGVDYALLLTSRFREELGTRRAAGCRRDAGRPGSGQRGRGGDGRDRRARGVLQRPDGAAGPDRSDPVRVHGPALGRHRRGDGRRRSPWPARVTLLPAVLAILGPRVDAFRSTCRDVSTGFCGRRTEASGRRTTRRVGPPRATASWTGPCSSSCRRCWLLLILGTPFLHARFNAPDATILPPGVPSRVAYDTLVQRLRRGRVRATRPRGARPTDP